MIPYANTNEMKEVADDIKALASQLSETFDALYKRLSEVPEGTQEWIGGKANYYFATICSDKDEHSLYRIRNTSERNRERSLNTRRNRKRGKSGVIWQNLYTQKTV